MNKFGKALLSVIPACFLLSGTTVGLCFLSSDFVAYFTVCVVVLALSFFIVPSFMFALGMAKKYLANITFAQSFRMGYLWGGLIFLLLFLCAPISGILWFVETVYALNAYLKQKKDKENNRDKDIF